MKKTYFPIVTSLTITEKELIEHTFERTILNEAYLIEFKDHESIVRANEELPYLYFLLSGKAKIYATQDNGKRTLLQFLQPKDFIGELVVLEAENEVKDVVSIGYTRCLAIPMRVVEKQLMQQLSFVKLLGRYVSKKLLWRMEHFTRNQSFELKFRLAKLILQLSVDGIYKEKHSEIAEFLGVSYRHLLHTLKLFQEEGYMTKIASGYQVNEEKMNELID